MRPWKRPRGCPMQEKKVTEPFLLTVQIPGETLLKVHGVLKASLMLADGSIGIHPGHAPLLAETTAGPMQYTDETGEHQVDLERGILQIRKNQVVVFTSGFAGQKTELSSVADEQFDRLTWELMDSLTTSPSFGMVSNAGLQGIEEPSTSRDNDGE